MKYELAKYEIKKHKIINAAFKRIYEQGIEGTTMRSIAKEAKVNQALLHYHFGSKENLYLEVLHRLFGTEQKKRLAAFGEEWNLTPSQKLYLAIYVMVNLHLEAADPDFNRIIAREAGEGRGHLKKIIREYLVPLNDRFVDIIDEGVKSGDFETKNSHFVVLSIVTFVVIYESSRENFSGTPWEIELYGKNSKENVLNFMVEHTFKALRPGGKKLAIPNMPGWIIKEMDETIEKIKKENRLDA